MATASLTGMPLELLVHLIATYLPTKDLGALRLTSKYLEEALFNTFSKEFFTKKQFMLTTPSLQALVDISRHGEFNKTLKHCIIGLEAFDYSTPGHWVMGNSSVANGQDEAFCVGQADQFALLNTGRGRDLLAEAFRNLPNLETLGIRDYDAAGRIRDDSRWRSYGAPTVYRETSRHLDTGGSGFASRVFPLLVQALAEANRPVPSIEVILRRPNCALNNFAFFLPASDHKLDVILEGLNQLLLTVNPVDQKGLSTWASFTWMEAFLIRTTSLQHLRLNVKNPAKLGWFEVIVRRMSTTPNLLPNLHRLDIGMADIDPETLVQFITKFSTTLRHLSLWKVCLEYNSNTAAHWLNSEDRFHPWPRLFRDLLSATQLTGMTIGNLTQNDHVQIRFTDGLVSHDYTGDMEVWIPQLIDDLKFDWPQLPAIVDTDSNDESDDEDEEEEEEEEEEEDEREEENEMGEDT